MKRTSALFLNSVLAGICIALGGTLYLRLRDAFPGATVVGALFFSLGLLTICTRSYTLFTGKACYLLDNPLPAYLWDLFVIWFGNLVGCALIAGLQSLTPLFGPKGINVVAAQVVAQKSEASYLALFILGLFCNIFIYIAVNGFQNNPHEFGKYLILMFAVAGFILAGTEHSVADMYFWCVSGALYHAPGDSLIRIFIVTLGNTAGGVLPRLLEQAKLRLDP